MTRLETLIALAVFMVATSTVHANDQPAFSKWLGPQTNDNATPFAPVVGKRIDAAKHDKLPRYDITLEIVKGGDLKLPVSENAIITFDGGEFTAMKDFHPDKDATYLFCRMQLKPDKLGWRFYTLNARIIDGNLKGAIVHLRDGKIQDSITDPCVAIYRIPDDLNVEVGKAPFEIVALFAK
ncbi:MAG: hypothetical protein KDB14_09815 [Planctomycetales bacterium]|nr:hypothetical protein [Planctomycetales bacterium]